MLLPRRCAVCRSIGPSPCASCIAGMSRAPTLPPPLGLDGCAALLAYEDAGRDLILALKYRNGRGAVPWLAAGMAALVTDPVDAVTWVPTSGRRRRRRGFDQARLLAGGVARALGVRARPLLGRRAGPPQTGRSAADRRRGPRFTTGRGRPPARVLVVDDVVTTGASLTAAATTLRATGATRVVAVTAARTPRRRLH